jgi:DNA repair photolyase
VEQAPLFPDLTLPTTRDVARLVRDGGVEAVGGVRRADDATYREIRCRSALNRVRGMPFKWTLNPYRGCTHGCHYCFARRYQTQFELDAGDQFASLIFVKTNFVDRLRAELDKPSWTREQVALGTATDPYQPIEGTYRLTRGALECLARAATPVGLVTKGPMVLRDRDVLTELGGRAECRVYLSVPTVDEDGWRRLEPGTAHPMQRLRAVRELVDAGLDAGVLMAPIVPGLTSQPAKLDRTVKAIADSGARHVGAMVMHLEGGTRDHFMGFLAREYPELVEQYGHLYAGKHAPRPYQDRVQEVVGMLKARYGLPGRSPRKRGPDGKAGGRR